MFKLKNINRFFSTINNTTRQNANIEKVSFDKVDVSKLSPVQKMYIDKINARNLEVIKKMKKQKRMARSMGIFLGIFVIGVYTYTIVNLKQERFLDDFEVPELVEIDKKKKSH
jgi:hypothetical protein